MGVVTLFAIGTSFLSWSNARTTDLAPRFHWPDETTNHFFATRVARGEPLAVTEPRNPDVGNLIHPRTANVRADGAIVPGAYLGLPLWYGMVGRAFSAFGGSVGGERAMLFMTPVLAALGLLAFAAIIRRLWNPGENIRMIRMPDPNASNSATVAVVATVLLALHPSLWLFTATAFLPNVPFVALVLMGFAVLARADSRQPTADRTTHRRSRSTSHFSLLTSHFSSGLLIGLALTIRTHEALWVAVLVAIIVWFQTRDRIGSGRWSTIGYRLSAIGFGLALPFLPILFLNAQLYGSPFTTGYALLQEGGAAPTEFTSSLLPNWLTAFVAPFGWHPIEAFARFWKYAVAPFSWFFGLAAVGAFSACIASTRRRVTYFVCGRTQNMSPQFSGRVVGDQPMRPPSPGPEGRAVSSVRFAPRHSTSAIAISIALVVWLILYYGSWTIADPLVRETNVLTISYVRYWLPVVILGAWWAGVGFVWCIRRAPQRWHPVLVAIIIIAIALTSARVIVRDPLEGLLRQRAALAEHRSRARAVIAATEPDAVVISQRMDKAFFPERAVVHAPDAFGADAAFLGNLRRLVDRAPVYWYAPQEVVVPGFALTPIAGAPNGEWLARVR